VSLTKLKTDSQCRIETTHTSTYDKEIGNDLKRYSF